jgi:hypothetical protein
MYVYVYSRGIRRGGDGEDENDTPIPTPFEKFFRGIIVRFSNGWRPDIFDTCLPGHIGIYVYMYIYIYI